MELITLIVVIIVILVITMSNNQERLLGSRYWYCVVNGEGSSKYCAKRYPNWPNGHACKHDEQCHAGKCLYCNSHEVKDARTGWYCGTYYGLGACP
jgi:hypothetical protein